MALSPADIDSFIAALQDDAALRDRVRDAILSSEFRALPAAVQAIDERVARLDERVAELDERMARAHAEHVVRMDALDERIRELDARLTARLDALAANMDARFNRIEGRLGNVERWQYEARYRDRLTSHLARRVRKVRAIAPSELDAMFDAYKAGDILDDDWDDLHRLDVLAVGSDPGEPGERIFAIELSITVDISDVTRARRRADILGRFGVDAEPMVDGDQITVEARTLAEQLGVTVLVRRSSPQSAA